MTLQPRAIFSTAFATRAPLTGLFDTETTLLERADVGGLLVNSAVDASVVISTLTSATGFPFPLEAGVSIETGAYRVLWLTPRSWLVHCPVDQEQLLAAGINEAFPDKRVHAALFTDYLCWFELTGSQAWRLLTGLGFITLERELSIGHAKRTLLAGVAAVVLRESAHVCLFGVERSRAVYIVARLRAAASKSHSLPFMRASTTPSVLLVTPS